MVNVLIQKNNKSWEQLGTRFTPLFPALAPFLFFFKKEKRRNCVGEME